MAEDGLFERFDALAQELDFLVLGDGVKGAGQRAEREQGEEAVLVFHGAGT